MDSQAHQAWQGLKGLRGFKVFKGRLAHRAFRVQTESAAL
jgi:hypothetical protein